MRRSAAPSRIVGSQPMLKRPRFLPPFVGSDACNPTEQITGTAFKSDSDKQEIVSDLINHSVYLHVPAGLTYHGVNVHG